MTKEEETKKWYAKQYRKQGIDRNNLLRNPEVLFQTLAQDAAVISALHSITVSSDTAKVIDVGCGGGESLLNFIRLGFATSNLTGIDIIKERTLIAKIRLPGINFITGNASKIKLPDETFDIVFESTMFMQLTDDVLSYSIANEMIRIAKTGSYIILVDWRFSKPGNPDYKGLSTDRLKKLFSVGSKTRLHSKHRGALVPPLGRFISKRIACIYFLLSTLFPFLVGQMVVVLQKSNNHL